MEKQLPDLEFLSQMLIQARDQAETGSLPHYIPWLQTVNPRWLAMAMLTLTGETQTLGDTEAVFPLMSVIKPFILLYVLCHQGEAFVRQRVGFQPSALPFNSLAQLQTDGGFPRNPMINSGAIALAACLPEDEGRSPCETLRLWLNQQAHCQLSLNQSVLASVRSLPNPKNQAIVEELAAKGYLQEPERALDTYNQVCCLSGTVRDLARLGLLLVQGSETVSLKHCQMVSEVMKNCGLYEASAAFAQQVGLPTKSGVSGAVLSLVPQWGAIACYSPPLDAQGNSVAGLWLVEQIAKQNISKS